jgi:hypothetical protein
MDKLTLAGQNEDLHLLGVRSESSTSTAIDSWMAWMPKKQISEK